MNPVEQIEVLVLSAEDLEIYIETDDELRCAYKHMTKEEVLSALDEPLKEIDTDFARRCGDGDAEPPIYWLRVSKSSDGSLGWGYEFLAAREPQPMNGEEKPCSQLK
jgi:hypothetical protein